MQTDYTADLEYLDWRIRTYEQQVAAGVLRVKGPLEICRGWQVLLKRDDVSASEAADFARRADVAQRTFNDGIAFFSMCGAVRSWCHDLYERELNQTFNPMSEQE